MARNIRIVFYDQNKNWKGSCTTQEEFADTIISGMKGYIWENTPSEMQNL